MTKKVTELIADRGFSAQPIYLTDLDRCQPGSALSTDPEVGRWRMMPYETDELSGVMLMAGTETAAPDVTYAPHVSGWHAVSVGVWPDSLTPGSTRWYVDLRTFTEVQIRHSDQDTSSILTLPGLEWSGLEVELMELFWNVVDLTDRDLVLGQVGWRLSSGDGVGARQSVNARIAYIKLVPLSEEEVRALQADRAQTDTKRLFAHNDAGGPLYYGPTSAADIRSHVENYRDSDISRLYWEAGAGDELNYLSKIGRIPTYDGLEDFGRYHHRLQAESWRLFRDQGIDPFKVALDAAHEMGLEFHAGYRVAGFHFPAPHDYFNEGQTFYKSHPELRGVDRDGNFTPRMAYTFPETRKYVISLLREMVEMGCDGVCLLYNRRPPLVEYEPPLIEGFKAEYGEDPRQIDEHDPRWLRYRATFLTRFMGEVRAELNTIAQEQGRSTPLRISAVVMASIEENLYHAIDLKAWIDEGLIDTIIPYSSFENLESMDEAWTDDRDIEPFVSLTRGTACELAPNIMPRQLTPEALRRRAAALYKTGVEHFFFWDTDPLQPRSNNSGPWNAVRRLGHREEIEAWMRAGEPSLGTPTMTIRALGDWDLSYRTPG